jgi:hypothetical protein
MKPLAQWTIGGDFRIVDADDDDAPLAVLTLHEPLKSLAIDDSQAVAEAIITALAETPHPYADDPLRDEG